MDYETPGNVSAWVQLVHYKEDFSGPSGITNSTISAGGDPETLAKLFSFAFKDMPFLKEAVIIALNQS